MKKFGGKFRDYETLEIKDIKESDVDNRFVAYHYKGDKRTPEEFRRQQKEYGERTKKQLEILKKLPKDFDRIETEDFIIKQVTLKGGRKQVIFAHKPGTVKFAQKGRIDEELDKARVGVAPAANVYQIPPDQKDLDESIKRTLSKFNYYVVELGLNVMLGREFKVPKLSLEFDLKCDTDERTDVVAYDLAPDDEIRTVEIISGRINLGVSNLLKFVPSIYGQILSNLIDIEINPIDFHWGIDKYMIDVAGRNDYRINWKIYETKNVQSFNPIMILKVRNNVNKVTAKAKCKYKLRTGFLSYDIKTSPSKTIKILPT